MHLVNIYNRGRKLYLFLRDKEGNRIVEEDESFFPYYYEKHPEGAFKSYDGQTLKKMFVTEPRDIKKIASFNSYEADLKFVKRFMIDRIDSLDECPIYQRHFLTLIKHQTL